MSASPRLPTPPRLHRAPECRDLGFALGPRINAGGRVGQVGPRRPPAHHRGSGRGRSDRRRARPAERGAPRDRGRGLARRPRHCRRRRAIARSPWSPAPGWHPGVIGIVAGRLKEKLHRPAIVIALGEDGIGKGSGRSISGVDLGAAVLAAKESGLLDRRRRPRDGGRAHCRGGADRGARRFPRRAARAPTSRGAATIAPCCSTLCSRRAGSRRLIATRSRRAALMAPAGRGRASPPARSGSSRRTWSAAAICG